MIAEVLLDHFPFAGEDRGLLAIPTEEGEPLLIAYIGATSQEGTPQGKHILCEVLSRSIDDGEEVE